MGKLNEYGLNSQQEKFCQLYAGDPKRNGAKAALGAGYSKKTARIIASENLTKPNILQRIKQLEIEALEEVGYSPDALRPVIMRRLVSIATTDVAEIVQVIYRDDAKRKEALAQMMENRDGQYFLDFGGPLLYIKPTSEWSPEQKAAVKGIKFDKGKITIETHDNVAALKLLAEITDIKKQSVDLDINVSMPESLSAARSRVLTLNAVEMTETTNTG